MEDTSREMEENKGVVDEVQWWLEGVFLPFLQLLGLAGERSSHTKGVGTLRPKSIRRT